LHEDVEMGTWHAYASALSSHACMLGVCHSPNRVENIWTSRRISAPVCAVGGRDGGQFTRHRTRARVLERVALAVGRLLPAFLGRGVRDGPSKLYSNQNKILYQPYFPEEAHGGAWGGKPRVHARCCIGCPGPYRSHAPTKKLHGDHVWYSKGEACQQVTHPHLVLGTLKKASAAAFQGTGSDPL
jgi:hypothetical protein